MRKGKNSLPAEVELWSESFGRTKITEQPDLCKDSNWLMMAQPVQNGCNQSPGTSRYFEAKTGGVYDRLIGQGAIARMIKNVVAFLRVHSDTNWAMADQAMVSGVTFLTGILLARGLGVADFGRFSLAWLVVLLVQSIQENAITAPMMSIGPKQDAQQGPSYYGGVFFQQGILAVISTVVCWASLRFAGTTFASNTAALAMPLAAAVLLSQTQEFLRRYLFTLQRPIASFAGDAIRYLGQLIILAWMFLASMTTHRVGTVLWVIAGASFASALVLLIFVGKLEWATSAFRHTTLHNWRFSRWLVGAAIVQWVSGNVFIVAAGALLGVAAVGALKAAQSLMGITNILFQGLENIAPIRAAHRFHSGGPADLVRYLAKVTRLGLTATAFTGLFFAIYPTFWIRMLFGEQFVQYGYLVRWYAALYVLMFLVVPIRFGLRAMEQTVPIFLAYLVAAIFSAVAAYPLVRTFELTGVLMGMFLVQLLMLGVVSISFRRALVAANVHR